MLLAGDIGGTKTLLGLFDPVAVRPRPIKVQSFGTLDYPNLSAMIAAFTHEVVERPHSVRSACFGVAGPVIGDTAQLTNVPWKIEARRVAEQFGFACVDLLNDLQAMAYGVPILHESEVQALQQG